MRGKHMAVAGVVVHRGELVHFLLRNSVQRSLMPPLTAQVPHMVPGLVSQDRLTKCVKADPLVMVAGVRSQFITPFRWGIRWSSPFPLPRHRRRLSVPAKWALFEKNLWKFLDSGKIRQKCPAGCRPAGQSANYSFFCILYALGCISSLSNN